jgi:hypothetical protein
VLLTAVFTALISQLSPFLGLIFLIASGGKNIILNFSYRYVFFILFSGIVILTTQLGLFPADLVRYADVLIGVGFGSFIFFIVLLKTSKYETAILSFSGITIIYAYVRSMVFGTIMLQNYDLMAKLNPAVLPMGKGLNPEQLAMFKYIVKIGRNLINHYNIAIWCIGMIIALYLGSLLLTKSKVLVWDHKFLKLPNELIYLVIGSMIMIVLPMTKLLGFNLLLAILPLYLIQATAIIDFFWGAHFAKSPILRFLLVLVLLLNYPLLVLLVLIGLLDNWLNFRKIEIREENDENHFVE